ncbi:LysR family transcriptional regulator [Methylobacterium sp. J-078]|uniref:helix-turn-helix domain-containing protein n=1 Tax=Methylobacterium sp. J-078 TaxID=2836657 RepID=UPI00391CC1E3
MINPAHLDLFRAVMRHGGMTRAAEALGIGQPHVSRAMAQLEAETGLPIVLRPFRPALPIETRLIRPAARPPGRLVERLVDFLRLERDALASRRTDDAAGSDRTAVPE